MNARSTHAESLRFIAVSRAGMVVAILLALCGTTPRARALGPETIRRQPEPPPAATEPSSPATPNATKSPADDLATLIRAGAGLINRKAAASRLLLSEDPAIQASVVALLHGTQPAPAQPAEASPAPPPVNGQNANQTNGTGRDSPREVLLSVIAASPAVADWVGTALVAVTRDPARTTPPSTALLAALASARTQAAVRTLLDVARNAPAETRTPALQSLRRLTGRDLGDDLAAWSAWFAGVEFLGEADWRRVLWEGLAQRSDALAGVADTATLRLVDLKRRDFLALPQDGPARSQLLASLLVDELAPLRRLGIDLARRELANGRVPDEFVVDSTVELLGHPEAEFRGAAASLLAALAPVAAGEIVTEALLREQSPAAAGAMLGAAARWPRASILGTVLSWLEGDPAARSGAIEAAAALRRAGFLDQPEDRQRVGKILRAMAPTTMTDTATWLLAQVGQPEDRAYLITWLAHADPALRARAAEALAGVPEGADPILAAAQGDPNLFAAACKATVSGGATPARLAALLKLTAPTPESRERGLALAASAATLADALAFASAIESPSLRESLLGQLVLFRARAGGLELSESERQAVSAGIRTLARTRLDLRQPARALDALEIPSLTPPTPTASPADPPTAALRVTALAWLNRLEDALALRGGPAPWLDALEYAIDLPHARAIADIVRHRYTESEMTPEAQERLTRLIARLEQPSP